MSDKKQERVYRIFQTVADGYDSANHRISLGMHMKWKESAARWICSPGGKYLDLGCGTGDMLDLLHALDSEGQLYGVDFSPNMLAVAKKRLQGIDKITLMEGNALTIPFTDNSFDALSISFVLRNTSDYSRVVLEMSRVLKKGGKLCCIDSFLPETSIVRPLYELYFSWLMPLLGGGKKKYTEYRWLSQSTHKFISASELELLMNMYGLKVIKRKTYMFGACVCICAVREETA